MNGTIIKATGSWYNVRHESSNTITPCRIKGKFRLADERLNNPVAVGDFVEFDLESSEEGSKGIIHKIKPRRNYVIRSSTSKRHQLHLIACNVDQVLLVTSISQPRMKPGFIDRFLLTTSTQDIPTTILFSKADIYDEEDMAIYEAIKNIYEPLGYPCYLMSAHTGQGLDVFEELLKDKVSLISGNSGVGKSSLVNALEPDLDLKTLELSGYTGKGQHSTTFAEMHDLKLGGQIVDTPGIKEMGFINLKPQDVAHNYREFFEASQRCKYRGCLHLNEPNCAVREAIETETISSLRYQSYCSIMEEVQNVNYWERKTM